MRVCGRKENQPCMFFFVDRMDVPTPPPVQKKTLQTIAEAMPDGAVVHALLTHASVKPPGQMQGPAGNRSLVRRLQNCPICVLIAVRAAGGCEACAGGQPS